MLPATLPVAPAGSSHLARPLSGSRWLSTSALGTPTDIAPALAFALLPPSEDQTRLAASNPLFITLTGDGAANTLTGTADADTLDGAGGNDTLIGGAGNDTLIGGLGSDTADYSADAGPVVVNLLTNTATDGWGATDTLNSIERVIGSAFADTLTGGAGANILTGGADNDTINGGAGADTMIGGTGDDAYFVDNVSDVITEAFDEGTDSVQSSVTYTLSDDVENLTLTGANAINGRGNAIANIIIGNGASNSLSGFAGNDTLDGGLGADTMFGGEGDDTYYVDNVADVTLEPNSAWGTDIVYASVTYTLGSNIDNLTLVGSSNLRGNGNEINNTVTGNTGVNVLYGYEGNDTLIGGLGADKMYDNDTIRPGDDYVADHLNGGNGIDTLDYSALKQDGVYAVGSANTVFRSTVAERDLLTAATFEGIIGSAAADIFDVRFSTIVTASGGDGDDYILMPNGGVATGGAGRDFYYVDSGTITITDFNITEDYFLYITINGMSVGSNDTMLFTSNGNILILGITSVPLGQWQSRAATGGGFVGTENADGAGGNGLPNYFSGGAGNDNFFGDAGDDSLIGGAGSDVLVGGDGDDRLESGSGGGILDGQIGNDFLFGGTGNETMVGGAGNDRFIFATGGGTDAITDFDADSFAGQDVMDISALGVTAGDFGTRVLIEDLGNDTRVTIDGSVVINLQFVTGDGANVITIDDFILA